jgi:hypothetical protein
MIRSRWIETTICDRMSPLTILLDDVVFKSSIRDMRQHYFSATKNEQNWLLLSDYYFGGDKPNKVITFTAMPYCPYVSELKTAIKDVAPKDIKHTRSISSDFVALINMLPAISFVFIFDNARHFIWETVAEAKETILEHIAILYAYIEHWRKTEPAKVRRLDKLSKNLKSLERLLESGQKLRIVSAMFLISLLGGYVSSIICRETSLSTLVWLSDRDSTNEIGDNIIRDLFQITLIDIIKRNINFAFTTSNSNSDEWYEEMTRIPDYLTGTISGFNFDEHRSIDNKTAKMLGLHFRDNIINTFLYRFKLNDEHIRLQRLLITHNQDITVSGIPE